MRRQLRRTRAAILKSCKRICPIEARAHRVPLSTSALSLETIRWAWLKTTGATGWSLSSGCSCRQRALIAVPVLHVSSTSLNFLLSETLGRSRPSLVRILECTQICSCIFSKVSSSSPLRTSWPPKAIVETVLLTIAHDRLAGKPTVPTYRNAHLLGQSSADRRHDLSKCLDGPLAGVALTVS